MKKKILIASAAFFPENSPRAFRATELAKQFAREGHDVKVISIDRGRDAEVFCLENNIKLEVLRPLVLKAIRVAERGIMNILTRGINRLLLMLLEYPDIELMFKYRKLISKERGYDLLISIAVPYPVHWGVAWGWNRKIAKCWVADCGDPYMGNTTDSFKKLFYFKYVEKWFSRKVDYISITNINMIGNYYQEFHHKIIEITQGFDFDDSTRNLPIYTRNPIPTFAYSGSFIEEYRDPKELLKYLVDLPIDFKFYIYTSQRYLVEPYVEKSKGRIELMPLIPRKQLLIILRKMDFLLNISFDVKVQSPSKLIDYYIVDRPVLSLASHEVDVEKIQEFLKGNYSKRFQFIDYDKFKIENVCRRFLSLTNNKNSVL